MPLWQSLRHASFLTIVTKSNPQQTRSFLVIVTVPSSDRHESFLVNPRQSPILDRREPWWTAWWWSYIYFANNFFLLDRHGSFCTIMKMSQTRELLDHRDLSPILNRHANFLTIVTQSHPRQTWELLGQCDKVPSSTDMRASWSLWRSPILDCHESFLVNVTKSHPRHTGAMLNCMAVVLNLFC